MAKLRTLTEQLRRAVEMSGLSRYEICKRAEVAESMLSRFMNGRSTTLATADKLACVLGLELTATGPRPGKG